MKQLMVAKLISKASRFKCYSVVIWFDSIRQFQFDWFIQIDSDLNFPLLIWFVTKNFKDGMSMSGTGFREKPKRREFICPSAYLSARRVTQKETFFLPFFLCLFFFSNYIFRNWALFLTSFDRFNGLAFKSNTHLNR